MVEHPVLFAFALTLFAGLATGIGSLLALLLHKTSSRFLSVSLGFSAGIMIYVSFVEILAEARNDLVRLLGESRGNWLTLISFFAGMLLIAAIDRLVPEIENPHEARHVEAMSIEAGEFACDRSRLMRIGFMSAVAIAIHNFPEGLANFTAALNRPSLGLAITLAIALHNIPEGISVAIPIYCATGSRRKAFTWSLLSGLSEPLGALLGYLILRPIMNDQVMGMLFAIVAGIMVFISLDELLPTAREYGSPHLAIYGLMAGMAVMAISLMLFV